LEEGIGDQSRLVGIAPVSHVIHIIRYGGAQDVHEDGLHEDKAVIVVLREMHAPIHL